MQKHMRYETNLRMILKNQPFCRIRQQAIYLYNMDLHFNLGYNAVQEYSQTVGGGGSCFPVRFSEQAIGDCARNTKAPGRG